jgi:fluoroacetyl-CoA thioesterase
MASIPVGARGSFTLVVTAEHLANRFKDATLPPVLATPVMIMAMENAALNAIKPFLGAQESAVGMRVDVLHLAPTPVGRQVIAAAQVTKVEGRRVTFKIDATDGVASIGTGTHERIVIDIGRFVERLHKNPPLAGTGSHAGDCTASDFNDKDARVWGPVESRCYLQ